MPVIASHCELVPPVAPVLDPVLGLVPMPEVPVPLPVPTLGPDVLPEPTPEPVLPEPVLPLMPPDDCASDIPETPSNAAVTAAPSTLIIMARSLRWLERLRAGKSKRRTRPRECRLLFRNPSNAQELS
jgi:hypothetical protein